MSLRLLLIGVSALVMGGAKADYDASKLWERLGGIDKITKLIEETVRMHETDPLTRDWFGPGKFHNAGHHDAVVNSVLTFFSSAFGPEDIKQKFAYKGKSMAEAHKGMKLSDHAFHALAGHLITQLKVQGLGGPEERDFLLGVLKSVWQNDIKPNTHALVNSTDFIVFNAAAGPHWDTPTTPENIWVRLGGLDKISKLIDGTVRMHETDPLTRDWFGPSKFRNFGHHDAVYNAVLTFFASAFAPPNVKQQLEYKGRTMAEAHKGMKLPDHAFHALAGHLITQLKDQGIAGPNERDFLLGVLTSVWQEQIKPDTHQEGDDPDFIPFDVNSFSTNDL